MSITTVKEGLRKSYSFFSHMSLFYPVLEQPLKVALLMTFTLVVSSILSFDHLLLNAETRFYPCRPIRMLRSHTFTNKLFSRERSPQGS